MLHPVKKLMGCCFNICKVYSTSELHSENSSSAIHISSECTRSSINARILIQYIKSILGANKYVHHCITTIGINSI